MVSSIGKPDATRQDCGMLEKSEEKAAASDKEVLATPAAVVAVKLKSGDERPDAIRSLAVAEAEMHRMAAVIIANEPGILEIHNLDPARVEFLTRDEA